MKHLSVLVFAAAVLFCSCLSVWADGAVPVSEYSPQNVPALPDVLPAGIPVSTGGLTLKLLGNPSLSRSTRRMLAEVDTNYLMLRVMITNDSEEKLGWLAPASFVLQDTYLGRVYGSYKLDLPASAKAADDGIQNVFFPGSNPGNPFILPLHLMSTRMWRVGCLLSHRKLITADLWESRSSFSFLLPGCSKRSWQ